MVNRVAIRWSRAAKVPRRSCRFRVGWPMRIPANGEAQVHSALVSYAEFGVTGRWPEAVVIPSRCLHRRRGQATGTVPGCRSA
jgi:hypothetical protein